MNFANLIDLKPRERFFKSNFREGLSLKWLTVNCFFFFRLKQNETRKKNLKAIQSFFQLNSCVLIYIYLTPSKAGVSLARKELQRVKE